MEIALAKLRHIRGYTQDELAKKCNVSRSVIALIENSRMKSYPKIRQAIAEALEVEPSILWPELKGDGNGE